MATCSSPTAITTASARLTDKGSLRPSPARASKASPGMAVKRQPHNSTWRRAIPALLLMSRAMCTSPTTATAGFARLTGRVITTIAGSGGSSFRSTAARRLDTVLTNPTGLAFDAEGNLYVATNKRACLRTVLFERLIRMAASRPSPAPASWVSGDGGPATSANVSNPQGLAFDAEGNLYIADAGNGRVRRVDKKGIISTVVGAP